MKFDLVPQRILKVFFILLAPLCIPAFELAALNLIGFSSKLTYIGMGKVYVRLFGPYQGRQEVFYLYSKPQSLPILLSE